MRTPGVLALVVIAGVWAVGAKSTPLGQTTGHQNPPLVIRSVEGRDLFEFYCATCHGRDGKGAGPVVAALKTVPPDLTLIARRHGGTFPRAWVEAFITHDVPAPAPSHGTKEMPVWGPLFRGLDPSDTRAAIRIANVVRYVESLQAK